MGTIERTCGYHRPDREVMTTERRLQFQVGLLRERARDACRRSATTRGLFEEAGLDPSAIQAPEDIRRLAVTRKRDLPVLQRRLPPFGGLATVASGTLSHIFVSPGPIYDPEGREEDFWNLRAAFHAGGFRQGDVVQNTFAYHLTPAGLMCDQALRDLGCAVVPTGTGNTDAQVAVMRDLGVTAYIGTPSYLLAILERAAEIGVPRDTLQLEMAYVAAEVLAPSLRRRLEEAYGLHVRQGYITADLGAVGYECAERNGFHVPEDVIVDIVDPVSGEPREGDEPGEVVVTTLKESYPLFRFATGDLSAWLPGGRCPCGRTSPRLVGVLGRSDEVTKVKGMFVHPGMVREVLDRCAAGLCGQAVVTREGHRDRLAIRVVPLPGEPFEAMAGRIRELSREVLKLGAEVEAVSVEELGPRPKMIDDRRTWE